MMFWIGQLWQDVNYGARMLLRAPGFTAVAILSLAIGIGANTAIFSFADALFLRPLPVARPGEVMTVGTTATLESLRASSLVASYPEYVDLRDRSQSFEGLAAFTYITAGFTTDPRLAPKLKMGMLVSDNLFALMGVEPTQRDLYYKLDGTSMATPMVSGVIACFLSLRREFIGQPDKVKRILLANCTDLGRDRTMQGAGMPNLVKMLVQT